MSVFIGFTLHGLVDCCVTCTRNGFYIIVTIHEIASDYGIFCFPRLVQVKVVLQLLQRFEYKKMREVKLEYRSYQVSSFNSFSIQVCFFFTKEANRPKIIDESMIGNMIIKYDYGKY